MHMHVILKIMRTTIELPDELRAKLLAMAARRGEKGFSVLVEEAVERYLDEDERRRELVRLARTSIGGLSDEEGEELRESVRKARSVWRS